MPQIKRKLSVFNCFKPVSTNQYSRLRVCDISLRCNGFMKFNSFGNKKLFPKEFPSGLTHQLFFVDAPTGREESRAITISTVSIIN